MIFLIIDDNPFDREIVIHRLEKYYKTSTFIEVGDKESLERVFSNSKRGFDVAIIDFHLQWGNGIEVLKEIRSLYSNCPCIMVTGSTHERNIVKTMEEGLDVDDYLLKSHLQRLPKAVEKSIAKQELECDLLSSNQLLHISEQCYKHISGMLSNFGYAYQVQGTSWRCLWISDTFYDFSGYSQEELKEKDWLCLIHSEDAHLLEERRERLLSGQSFVQSMRILTKDGSVRWIRDYATCKWEKEKEKKGYIYGAFQDMTEQLRQEKLFRELFHTVEQNPTIIVFMDEKGNCEYANTKFTEVTGYSSEEMKGKNLRILKSDTTNEEEYRDLKQAICSGKGWQGELCNRKKNGEYYWEKALISPIRNDQGEITNFVKMAIDITEQRKMEKQFLQSQKMETIGRLAGGVAHDFNNMLTVVMGYAELILSKEDSTSIIYKRMKLILDAGRSASQLTKQLLIISKKSPVDPIILNINDIISELYNMLTRLLRKDIQLKLDLKPNIGLLKVDSTQMEQILLNLVVNARDAMPIGGILKIATSVSLPTKSRLKFYPKLKQDEYVHILVSDDGNGMSGETKEKLFDPFFTTKAEGTGLGLSTVYGIVIQNHGHIHVESIIKKGTTFHIFFPVQKKPGQKENLPIFLTEHIDLHGKETVLLVEDDEDIRDIANESLCSWGYHTLIVSNAEDAIECLQAYPDNIDLLVTDIVLPDQRGTEVADEIKVFFPDIKIIFISGYSYDSVIFGKNRKLTANESFLSKPFTPLQLIRKIRFVLDK